MTEFSRLEQAMSAAASAVEATLNSVLPRPQGLGARVQEAMRYATFAGGKRLRPFLVLSCANLLAVDKACALRVAAAIEAMHTYSLVHDDLPCMDDDDLRRGRPTTHKAFDEATAVLAGDALLTVAFEILSHPETHPSAEIRCELVRRLAEAAGSNGMVGGQMMDIEAETMTLDEATIAELQRMKTGALFEFCCDAGAILGEAGAEHRARLRDYARQFGLAFQISDDLLDVISTPETAGKAVGKDQSQGKATLVSAYGVDAAQKRLEQLARGAAGLLEPYGPAAADLRALPVFLLNRKA